MGLGSPLRNYITMKKIIWYCSFYTTRKGTEVWSSWDELPECNTEFTTMVSKEDWDNNSANAICPACGNTLWQMDDEPVMENL